jgi:SWI/SNF-related matrix-associated actin-dependent regulator of chromatin subfamily A3
MLRTLGIKFSTCFGSYAQRESGLAAFRDDPQCNLILLSTQFSSTGTNLTNSSVVIFVDPIYNQEERERVENQCIARVHRLGQKKPVRLKKLLVRATIEETCWHRDHP